MISEVFENQTLYMENVLYYRGWINQQGSTEVFAKMEQRLTEQQAQKNGAVVTVTNNIEQRDGQSVMDIEVFIPLDKEITVTDDYKFIPTFQITNALRIRIEGNPGQWETAIQTLSEYIQSNNLKPVTPLCVATVKEAKTPLEIDGMITDIYVGIEK